MSPNYAYLKKNGEAWQYHRQGQKTWEHPVDKPYMIDAGEVKPCPICDRSYKQ